MAQSGLVGVNSVSNLRGFPLRITMFILGENCNDDIESLGECVIELKMSMVFVAMNIEL